MLTEPRLRYKPFEYETAHELGKKQWNSFWTADECALTEDILDWNTKLTENEKRVVGGVLKGFTQLELLIGDYWSGVDKWFPKPEISYMAKTFSAFEGIHAEAYNKLTESLGIDDFEAFLSDPQARKRLENLIEIKKETKEEIARSLAIFSAFAEGVSLFSSFAVLMRFPIMNKLKGVGTIVEYSSRDENLHSKAGIWLFNQLITENPFLKTKELEDSIYEAARVCVELEEGFIKSIFEQGDLLGLKAEDLKNYIRARANQKLIDLGYKPIIEYNRKSAESISSWFDTLTAAGRNHDFFVTTETNYSQSKKFDPKKLTFNF